MNNFIDPERQAFETWFTGNSEVAADFLKLDENGIDYFHDHTIFAWAAWQASAEKKNYFIANELKRLWASIEKLCVERTKNYPSIWDMYGDRQEEKLANDAKRQEVLDMMSVIKSEVEKTYVQFMKK